MLAEYGQSHQNKTNQLIHKICVPAIMLSLLGLLWSIPVPVSIPQYINYASVFGAICLVYYCLLSVKYFFLMLPTLALMLFILNWIDTSVGNLVLISGGTFIVSWILQFIGHKIEGKKPSFLKDLLFLLIGPLWVYKSIFNLKGETST